MEAGVPGVVARLMLPGMMGAPVTETTALELVMLPLELVTTTLKVPAASGLSAVRVRNGLVAPGMGTPFLRHW